MNLNNIDIKQKDEDFWDYLNSNLKHDDQMLSSFFDISHRKRVFSLFTRVMDKASDNKVSGNSFMNLCCSLHKVIDLFNEGVSEFNEAPVIISRKINKKAFVANKDKIKKAKEKKENELKMLNAKEKMVDNQIDLMESLYRKPLDKEKIDKPLEQFNTFCHEKIKFLEDKEQEIKSLLSVHQTLSEEVKEMKSFCISKGKNMLMPEMDEKKNKNYKMENITKENNSLKYDIKILTEENQSLTNIIKNRDVNAIIAEKDEVIEKLNLEINALKRERTEESEKVINNDDRKQIASHFFDSESIETKKLETEVNVELMKNKTYQMMVNKINEAHSELIRLGDIISSEKLIIKRFKQEIMELKFKKETLIQLKDEKVKNVLSELLEIKRQMLK